LVKLLAAVSLGAVLLLSGCASLARRSQAEVLVDISSGDKQRATDALCTAVAQNWLDLARQAFDAGADPNGRSSDHHILVLHYAVANENIDAVKLLYERGTDPFAALEDRTYKGFGDHTALEYMELVNKRSMASLLKESARSRSSRQPGNLDDAASDRMRAAASLPAEKRGPSSDVDATSRRGAERPNDFALVIGIEDYQSLPKADYGARDAQTVRKHFEALGVPARNIISLEGSQATGSKLKNYLQQWLPRNVKPESTVFVYYSGHGAPDPENGDAYLVPWDADPMFLTTSAYPLKQFYSELAKLKAKRVVVALDACFSGSGGRSVLAKGARPLVAKVDESVPSAANLTVLAAASGSEITGTLDDQAHGIFTYYFLKGLSGGAKTPRALYEYLKPHVQDDARRQNREQSPTLAGSGADASF
jgi:hypothetical protein